MFSTYIFLLFGFFLRVLSRLLSLFVFSVLTAFIVRSDAYKRAMVHLHHPTRLLVQFGAASQRTAPLTLTGFARPAGKECYNFNGICKGWRCIWVPKIKYFKLNLWGRGKHMR